MATTTNNEGLFHPLDLAAIEDVERPARFTNPFDYAPHPLVELAREQLCGYLKAPHPWHTEIAEGKMFGVLVVENSCGELGFLAAFSGYLAKRTRHPYFVPPILDLLEEGGFFATEEANISSINQQIAQIDSSTQLAEARNALSALQAEEQSTLELMREQYSTSRTRRRAMRQEGCSEEQLAELNRESQHQKGVIRRCEVDFRTRRAPLEELIAESEATRNRLLEERKRRSAALQSLTFSRFEPLNGEGVRRNLITIFEEYNRSTPPAGSGECAAPKLLHYAFDNSLKPITMGEFWWGNSTRGEIRHHLQYYPACRGKCHPILTHMLRGLEIDPPRPKTTEEELLAKLHIIYEDDAIVAFNKPSGLPSVKGLNHTLSVQSIAEERYPHINPNNLIVHRLDMDTSGVLIVAKSAEVQRELQRQFADHTIRKRYIALLDGVIETTSGAIELPLALDPNDRPRQRVDYAVGKEAYTHYNVIEKSDTQTRIALYPQTGRTHQLRVHCAHPQGLNTPIVGDPLYGTPARRLMLHAELITLSHPTTGRKFTLHCEVEF